ncbi:hypothetical protein D7V94_04335 [Parablautia intestinalis]|uniref:Uncharacterized protein n=1 Tax=Parablautia intestinalis TaxID=2320100 RepID=A0A3A9ANT3_9FIRM|nr:hypothetical protein D7V94_04335 [Parablautia intestinalis]
MHYEHFKQALENKALEMMGTSFAGPFMHRPAQGKYVAKAAHGPRGKQGENIPCQLKRSVFEAYRHMYNKPAGEIGIRKEW